MICGDNQVRRVALRRRARHPALDTKLFIRTASCLGVEIYLISDRAVSPNERKELTTLHARSSLHNYDFAY